MRGLTRQSMLADEKGALTKGGFIFDAPVSHQLTRASFVWATLVGYCL
jgi:autoinducer 2 (AI-2) kinase